MDKMTLNGEWRFALDPADAGLAEGWAGRDLAERVTLPGSLVGQGKGEAPGAATAWTGTIFDRNYFTEPAYAPFRPPAPVQLPFWLTPRTVYVGAAWYQCEVDLPATWVGRRVVLTLERPHGQTRVWLGAVERGPQDSLGVPHGYDFGLLAEPGRRRLTVRVDNRLQVAVGENAHSVSDHTQGNWNGIVGRIELAAEAPVWIDDLQVHPDVARRAAGVRGRVASAGNAVRPARVRLRVAEVEAEAEIQADGRFAAELALPAGAAVWDEFTPVLHTLTATLPGGEARSVRFGLREVRARGRQLELNGRPLFLRGTLDCAVFPLTGHPPTEVAEWRRILGVIKGHGLNHVRFHSWCPPEAAFEAGDELGLYFQVEASTWPNAVAVLAFNSPAGIGDGAGVDAWALAEGERMLRAYGNHPCFLLMAAGNEPGGPGHRDYLARWVEAMRAADPRRLYTGAAGWPELDANDFHVLPEPRLHQWGDGLKSRLNAAPPATEADYRVSVEKRARPLISHEIGQWCAYPPLGAAADYAGPLRAGNYAIFSAWLRARGLAERLDDFVRASGRLQALCYKEEIEAQLRTPGLGGFQLLGLQDFPGQGTAPVGVLDHFWRSKGYVSAAEFRRFCGPTVMLARLPRRVFTAGETLTARLELAHFGAAPLTGAVAWWRLEDGRGEVVAEGTTAAVDVPVGNGGALGGIAVELPAFAAARRLRLVAGLAGTAVENDWALWVYPATAAAPVPAGVLVTRRLDAEAEARLRAGGRVVVFAGRGRARGDARGRVELGFTPIFWNTACTQGQAPHTLGLVCEPGHPALAGFPTEAHTDWQWATLLARADALLLDRLPRELWPVVAVIDDWYTNRRLGLIVEARVGAGRVLVCGVDLAEGLEHDPAARQLRASLLAYAAGPAFAPAVEVEFEALAGLLAE